MALSIASAGSSFASEYVAASFPRSLELISSTGVLPFSTVKCRCRTGKRRSLITNVYTGGISVSRAAQTTKWKEKLETEPDAISILNERIRRDLGNRDSSRTVMDSQEAEKYIQLVKEQQQRGLQKLKGEGEGNSDGFSYKVDPYTLRPGDYVVHKRVGVGRFVGIKYDVPKDSTEPIEYVFIDYADGMAKLPVKQASRLLYRYNLPNETKKPKTLSKLNDTSAWERRRIKGKIAIQKMVVDLMELYLHRLKQKRLPYPKSTGMDDFVAQFPYEPTPDQKQAFIDVEKDLTERGTPMDRLICGDVGFGKTEVALRAIFCVVSAGKQAMVLAPTIVLAKQHFDVISERFSRYPYIKVGLLSRFQTKAEKEEHLSMIKHGHLEIIVGTHALLGNRVVYNNLGLLVVDEEQKFGVKQKEKIASFKTSVDVLTLSATPIPRTLYLALTGFRDASLISTPPPERVPIKTHLSAYSEEKVLSAINFELDRGGQVFYVLPRIKGLEEVMQFLELSFRNVEIAIAHGKQYSKQLEETMEKFAQGEIKILICTNIVESGLDIQNANTIIIQDVQQFGLAQLYQLRGRVGRADKEAYAHLFYPDKSLLSDQALERLTALEECRDLGQGFQVAERDMGIRGFGNIFGEQQTGDVGNVGIDLFFEMLFESLSKVEEHRLVSVPYHSVQLDIKISPHLPSEYINYLENPMEIISKAERAAEKGIWSLMQFTENLRCQYGKEPLSMEILLKKLYVKRMAADLGITRIYALGKMVGMETQMSKKVFKLMTESMASDVHRNSLVLKENQIMAELLLELPIEQLLNWIFQCLTELHASLPALVKY
ncbi:ATP-dependent DNA helicase At3g02060, chloroplastic [Macadamia integrifolia]|uniref:ATP-dependent DNA helicase At3g02060, chloroplastic n=1 Tax=Macadamia integrifolia TaxID=60698 RepID=UPI001C4EF62F|nr:ATP-dependent DNA helicase At3g02060, chloroplastic [Macadamia integrifolia]XP_042501447.1 ATP-dependent DNA helicase At3g02060, chloroplastic [Macadamia integrifolia]